MIYPQNFSLEGASFFVYKILKMPSGMEEEKLGAWMGTELLKVQPGLTYSARKCHITWWLALMWP